MREHGEGYVRPRTSPKSGTAGDSRQTRTAPQSCKPFSKCACSETVWVQAVRNCGGLVQAGNVRQIFTAAVNCSKKPNRVSAKSARTSGTRAPFGARNRTRREPWLRSVHHIFHDVHDHISA